MKWQTTNFQLNSMLFHFSANTSNTFTRTRFFPHRTGWPLARSFQLEFNERVFVLAKPIIIPAAGSYFCTQSELYRRVENSKVWTGLLLDDFIDLATLACADVGGS